MNDDTINRKKAINAIERRRKERTMSDDLIKRSDAIKAVNREKSDWNCDYNVPIDNCIKRLNKVKSADRPQGEWIPCNERMPKEDGYYLVKLSFAWGNDVEMGWLLDGEWVNPNSHVTVAWMPLPEPWKGADDERGLNKAE